MNLTQPPSDLFRAMAHATTDHILGSERVDRVLDAMADEANTQDVPCEVVDPKQLPAA